MCPAPPGAATNIPAGFATAGETSNESRNHIKIGIPSRQTTSLILLAYTFYIQSFLANAPLHV
jgi:hypothetical protein